MRVATLTLGLCYLIGSSCGTALAEDREPAKGEAISSQDIAMLEDGTVAGMIVDKQGNPISDLPCTMQYGKLEVAKVKTGADGKFMIRGLRSGVHEMKFAKSSATVRLWSQKSAPPAAKSTLTLVADEDAVVRGQNVDVGRALRVASYNNPGYIQGPLYSQAPLTFPSFQGFFAPTGLLTTAAVVGGTILIADSVDDDDDEVTAPAMDMDDTPASP